MVAHDILEKVSHLGGGGVGEARDGDHGHTLARRVRHAEQIAIRFSKTCDCRIESVCLHERRNSQSQRMTGQVSGADKASSTASSASAPAAGRAQP